MRRPRLKRALWVVTVLTVVAGSAVGPGRVAEAAGSLWRAEPAAARQ